jgi:hypothetical protein
MSRSTGLLTGWCNAYGAENPGGPVPAGGLITDPVSESAGQQHCGNRAAHRFVWVCQHGHRGQPVELCERHVVLLRARVGAQPVPCPRCQTEISDHKCWLALETVS